MKIYILMSDIIDDYTIIYQDLYWNNFNQMFIQLYIDLLCSL